VKRCFKCGDEKPLTEFYRHPKMADGYLGKCKSCTRIDVAQNYRARIDHYVEYERNRAQNPQRKEMALEYQRRRRRRDPIKAAAHIATSNAIRDGRLIRKPCESCGDANVDAHHDDYTRPLDVRWLCRRHHLAVHGKETHAQ
jgi:ribosomal protein S27AE